MPQLESGKISKPIFCLGDMADVLDTLLTDITRFRVLHQGVYQGFEHFARPPTEYGIRDLW